MPKWNPLDGGRYIMTSRRSSPAIPITAVLNGGTYRGMITGKNTIGVLLAMTQGWGMHFSKYKSRSQHMPVAVVIGWDQSLVSRRLHAGDYPEYDMAGSLRRRAGGIGQMRIERFAGAGER